MMPDDMVLQDMFQSARAQVAPQSRPEPAQAPPEAEWPFYCLGYDRDRFFLYTKEGRQVIAMSAKDLSSHGQLLKLADVNWFESNFASKEGFNARWVANELIRACYRAGVYDPDRVRGRGVWLDAGRSVMHLGDLLLVDGAEAALTDIKSRFIYEQGRPLTVTLGEPLTDDEGKKFLAMCRAVSWEDPTRDGSFFAGWVVSALIGGALMWRPHMWLLSDFGQGKSWVFNNIVTPILGNLALMAQGNTTESGIRGALGLDARPVLFEEAETQTEVDAARIQLVLNLARQASTEGSPPILKGTKDGGYNRFIVRGSFFMSSINAGLTQGADESRFVTVALVEGNPDQFDALKIAHAEASVPNMAGRMLARLLAMIPTVRANTEALADAIARTGAGRRVGDTLGTILACQMALVDQSQLTPEAAAKIVASREWIRNAAAEAKATPEWQRALAHLMQCEGMRRTVNGRTDNLTISELVGACRPSFGGDDTIDRRDADAQLRRMGMRVMDNNLVIGNRSTVIAGLFRGTPWSGGWLATLARVPGAWRGKEVRFTPAHKDKALVIPLSSILEDEA
ncbi:hypothetical protein [Falsiroseomonas tokyonensis]|uniref:DUF927 domain-containing protein n=1 Tax=Falsiroseomonas tokyonensis TaxID=430521 RepID=A0ABV7BYW5_9PROT|nr:hypothetical protein [Falsiroseomonas tokyonensis]MBU8540830.1 hypothetical protein [Falsiroseomonas tokyonensis]